MKANRITFLAIFCLAFSSISYGLSQPTVPGQSQVRAYTLPLPLDKSTPMERFDIDNIVDEAWNQSMQAKAPSAKKSKKQKTKDKILKQSKKSITFVVDEDLPAPKQTFTMLPSNEISSQIISKKGIPYVDHNVKKTSFDGEKLLAPHWSGLLTLCECPFRRVARQVGASSGQDGLEGGERQ